MRPVLWRRNYRATRIASLVTQARRAARPAHRLVARLASLGFPGLAERAEEWIGRRNPQDHDAALLRAMFARARDDLDAAEEHARRAAALSRGGQVGRTFLVSVLQERGRLERALAVLGPERTDRETLAQILSRIELHRLRGDVNHALALAEAAVARFPDRYGAVSKLIALRLGTGALEEALRAAEAACATFPANASAWVQHGMLLERAGDPHGAAAKASRALELNPALRQAQLLTLRALAFVGRHEDARRVFTEAMQDHGPRNPLSYDFLLDAARLARTEPAPELLRRLALAAAGAESPAFSAIVALAEDGEHRAAAEALARWLAKKWPDHRLIALATLFGDKLAPHLERAGLPPLRQLARRLMLDATATLRNDPGMAAADALVRDILAGEPGTDPNGPLVSYICPIHRPQDVANLLAQLSRQAWRNAEVVFCINGDGISEQDLALDPALGFAVRHLRLPPGRPVGFYLARSVACARGDYLLRIDADDIYDADYTRFVVGYLRRHGADIVSLAPYVFHFESLGQTYLGRPVNAPPVRDVAQHDRQAPGSGASLCARREVFERVGFDEDLALGEDIVFYRRAAASGLKVHHLPGYLHTAVRRADKSHHTWRSDDFRLLSSLSHYLGDDCLVLRPGQLPPPATEDPFAGLFGAPAFDAFQELRIENALRAMPVPLDLLAGPDTPLPHRDDELLRVLRTPDGRGDAGRQAIAVMPEDPAEEEALAERQGALSLCHDILPRLIGQGRKAFRSLGGIRRSDAAGFRDRFDRAGLRYAVLANPRTGSEHLCSLLGSIGLGQPGEIIRAPAAELLSRSPDPTTLLRTLLGMAEAEGVVGTKIITQYVLDGPLEGRIEDLLTWMVEAGFSFVWLRRYPVHAAVSSFIAAQRGVWHHISRRGAAQPAMAVPGAEPDMPPYDFEAIAVEMRRQVAWSQRLEDLTARVVPPERLMSVTYAALSQEPGPLVRRIAGFLGFQPLPGTVPVSAIRRLSDALPATQQYRARFEREWKARTTAVKAG